MPVSGHSCENGRCDPIEKRGICDQHRYALRVRLYRFLFAGATLCDNMFPVAIVRQNKIADLNVFNRLVSVKCQHKRPFRKAYMHLPSVQFLVHVQRPHPVDIVPGTLLSSITGAGPLPVNSRHHQGIKQPGNGLRICATAPDGLIEGIELPDHPFVLGVQWHPESLSDRYPAHQKLFDAFVRACTEKEP